MCLKRVYEKPQPKEVVEWGWKVVEVGENGEYRGLYMDDLYEVDKWMHDSTDVQIKTVDGNSYRSGFHILRTRDQATRVARTCKSLIFNAKLVRVKFKNVVARGKDAEDLDEIEDCGDCIVARSIFIFKNKKPEIKRRKKHESNYLRS